MLALHSFFKLLLYSLFSALLVFLSCDKPGEPIVPDPENVHMVYHSMSDDTEPEEIGIDAVWETNGIHVAWYDLRDRNLKEYTVWRRREDQSYFRIIKTIIIEQSKDTTFVDAYDAENSGEGLFLNKYYYYFVTATNSQGVTSGAADTLKYMLLSKPECRWPDGETFAAADALPVLTWDFDNIPNLYILRIENVFGQLHYAGIFQSSYDNTSQSKDLNDIQDLPVFTPGDYLWRIDSIGPDEDNSGSESVWKQFTIE